MLPRIVAKTAIWRPEQSQQPSYRRKYFEDVRPVGVVFFKQFQTSMIRLFELGEIFAVASSRTEAILGAQF